MNKLMVAMVMMLALGGCMTEDEPYDDVASQVSAVEETPAPTTDEEMRTVRGYCHDACGQQQINRNAMCYEVYIPRNSQPSDGQFTLFDDCMAASAQMAGVCAGQCERTWGS